MEQPLPIQNLLKQLRCALCSDFADTPVETDCCRHIFCKACLKSAPKCPHCGRKDVGYRENFSVKKVIDNMEQACQNGCGERTTRENLVDHLRSCRLRQYHCPNDYCKFSGVEHLFLQHMMDHHRDIVLDRLTALPTPPPAASPDPLPGQFINRDGNLATMGRNAKFYCTHGEVLKRRRLSDMAIKMEKGVCGPATIRGSNCNACMALDVKFRGLPIGFLVNSEGVVCLPVACIHGRNPPQPGHGPRRRNSNVNPCSLAKCGTAPLYYCDRPHVAHNEDGTLRPVEKCHPLNRCSACEILRLQVDNGAYADVWEGMDND